MPLADESFSPLRQIPPSWINRKVFESHSPGTDAHAEELIVTRELSMNLVFCNPYYDSFWSLPSWAKKTPNDHRNDRGRDPVYSSSQLERSETNDSYWNAAQSEMVLNGKMLGYMRMYWGKKLLEWNSDPETAIRLAIHLNDKYEIDGRDPMVMQEFSGASENTVEHSPNAKYLGKLGI